MKRLRNLTIADFDSRPIWRYKGEADCSAMVEPDETFRTDGSACWVVKTRFTLADETVLWGYCSPIDDDIDYVQPVIILRSHVHLRVFSTTAPHGLDAQIVCEQLSKTTAEVFPMRFECAVAFTDGTRLQGTVNVDGCRIKTA